MPQQDPGDKNGISIDPLPLKKAVLVLKAISHPGRHRMLQLIHGHGAIAVTELYMKLGLEQSITSQHLAILRRAGLVRTHRQGRRIVYSVDYRRIKEVEGMARQLARTG